MIMFQTADMEGLDEFKVELASLETLLKLKRSKINQSKNENRVNSILFLVAISLALDPANTSIFFAIFLFDEFRLTETGRKFNVRVVIVAAALLALRLRLSPEIESTTVATFLSKSQVQNYERIKKKMLDLVDIDLHVNPWKFVMLVTYRNVDKVLHRQTAIYITILSNVILTLADSLDSLKFYTACVVSRAACSHCALVSQV